MFYFYCELQNSCGKGEGFVYLIPQMSLKWTKMKSYGLRNFLFTLSNMAIPVDLPIVEDCECLSYCADEYGHQIKQNKQRRMGDCAPCDGDPCADRCIIASPDSGSCNPLDFKLIRQLLIYLIH